MTFPTVVRTATRFRPDTSRTITKRFAPTGGELEDGTNRLDRILRRILSLDESQVHIELERTLRRFEGRHRDFRATLNESFVAIVHSVSHPEDLSDDQRLLIGAYFTHEYSLEAAALSNPSVVVAPDQSGLEIGETRIVVSLRAIGEGHISSIQFRTGVIHLDGRITMDAPGSHPITARHRSTRYVKDIFRAKLIELRVHGEIAAAVLEPLTDEFSMDELNAAIARVHDGQDVASEASRATRALHWLAASNYESAFPISSELSERVLFPAGPTESSGMEDARFVRFTDEEGNATYFATYTAYDGYQILPQLIETTDLLTFRMATLNGECARNKGIALFPRKIRGQYAALGRLDNENNFYMTSSDVRFWHEAHVIQRPSRPWELTHIGNCGSPIETKEGWLVITHGVGPMRQYAIGALLLDLDDPTRVIGSLQEPLLEPNEEEREGYVPNVVYSCGSIVVAGNLILPYGFSDSGATIATIELSHLLTELTTERCSPNPGAH